MALTFLLYVIRSREEPSRTTEYARIGDALKELYLELGFVLRAKVAAPRQKRWVVGKMDAKLS